METSANEYLIIKLLAENCGNFRKYYKLRRIKYAQRKTRFSSDVPRENTSVSILCLSYEQGNAHQHPYYLKHKKTPQKTKTKPKVQTFGYFQEALSEYTQYH